MEFRRGHVHESDPTTGATEGRAAAAGRRAGPAFVARRYVRPAVEIDRQIESMDGERPETSTERGSVPCHAQAVV